MIIMSLPEYTALPLFRVLVYSSLICWDALSFNELTGLTAVTEKSAERPLQLAVIVTESLWEAFDFTVTIPVSETVAIFVLLLFQITALFVGAIL